MQLNRKMVIGTVFSLMLAASCNASTWTLTPASHVGFSIDSMGMNIVKGQFKQVQSTLNFDAQQPQQASTSFSLDVNSLSISKPSLKTMIMGKDLFYAEKYKTVSFKSTAFQPLGNSKYSIKGHLTLRGVTRPVVFNATLKQNAANAKLMDFYSSTVIKRSDFGMKKAVGGVGEKVNIQVSGQWQID